MLIRFPLAMIGGIVAYMIAMVMTVYDGMLSMVFQPIMGAILTAIACVLLILLGSPLLIPRLWTIWKRFWVVPLSLVILGIVAMLLSWHPALRVQVMHPELQSPVDSFQPVLALGGWAAMLFGILFFPRIALTPDGRWA